MALQEVEFDFVVDVLTSVVKGSNKGVDEAVKLDNFRTYLEDLILYESVARTYVEIGEKGDYPTPNIRAALIASEINREGKLEDGTRISLVRKYMKAEDYLNAKFKIKQFEKKYMGTLQEVLAEATVDVTSKEEVINPSILVKLGTAVMDRESGYYETRYSQEQQLYMKEAKQLWLIEKQKYLEQGLTDRPYYKILKDVFEGSQHHYPLVSKKALEKTANFTYKLDKDEYVSLDDLQEVYKYNDASKLVDVDVLNTYGNEIKDSMVAYEKRHEVKEPVKALK